MIDSRQALDFERPIVELENKIAELKQLGDLVLELDDRALEVERLAAVDHGRHPASIARASSSGWPKRRAPGSLLNQVRCRRA